MYILIKMEEIKERIDKALEDELNSIKLRDTPTTCSEFIIEFFKKFIFNFFLIFFYCILLIKNG